jgi:hypothetical protein
VVRRNLRGDARREWGEDPVDRVGEKGKQASTEVLRELARGFAFGPGRARFVAWHRVSGQARRGWFASLSLLISV